jgi:hypothetical protein
MSKQKLEKQRSIKHDDEMGNKLLAAMNKQGG